MANQKPNIPTIFIIFGATGDLMIKKIVPALFNLYTKNKFPKLFKIIGFARRGLSEEEFKSHIKQILSAHHEGESKAVEEFLKYFSYHRGKFEKEEDYVSLAKSLGNIDGEWKVCANKLFYLAVPPQYYKTIFEHLSSSGLTIPCGPEEGWTRVIVEKPFGKDLATAENLDELLAKLFKEEQIYRIDHYLAKEMLQNILVFRFTNNLLEGVWNNKNIEKIDIKLYESIGVEHRGAFYDGIGALRDVGQNHLLQMLALVTMDHPKTYEASDVRKKRAEILSTLKAFSNDEIQRLTYRAQYEGYKDIKGVNMHSQTETYFKVRAELTHPRWQGVPITLESGKKIEKQEKEISIAFKHPIPCLCPQNRHVQNKVVFQLEPQEVINISFFAKQPGLEYRIEHEKLQFHYRKSHEKAQYVEEYEKLLLDCIEGNQLLFLSTDEVRAMWKFTDPIIEAWEKNVIPLKIYKPNSMEVVEKATLEVVSTTPLKKEIGIVGLGKMGAATARLLLDKSWRVVGYNRTPDDTKLLEQEGLIGAYSLEELVNNLAKPRILYLMLPAGNAIDDMLFGESGLVKFFDKGDIIVDAGNSFYKESIKRGKKLEKHGLEYLDVGTSGGPGGARTGACLMVGGKQKTFDYLLPLFVDLATAQGVAFFEGAGAGHFVKMIHNGIEYGMMQAIAEGFTILKEAGYNLDLEKVTDVYNHGSVIESRLIGWLQAGFALHGQDLKNVSGTVAHTGEGKWTVETAGEMGLKVKIIDEALKFRVESEKNPSYTGKILSTLREQFGGHSINNSKIKVPFKDFQGSSRDLTPRGKQNSK